MWVYSFKSSRESDMPLYLQAHQVAWLATVSWMLVKTEDPWVWWRSLLLIELLVSRESSFSWPVPRAWFPQDALRSTRWCCLHTWGAVLRERNPNLGNLNFFNGLQTTRSPPWRKTVLTVPDTSALCFGMRHDPVSWGCPLYVPSRSVLWLSSLRGNIWRHLLKLSFRIPRVGTKQAI